MQLCVIEMNSIKNTVDLEISARFQFSRILRGEKIREFKNLAKIIIIALPKKNENLRILNFLKSKKRKLPDLQYMYMYIKQG